MRTILLTRGMPASGKDYWIEKNNLQPYTLSADNIRLLLQSPVTTSDGKLQITQQNDAKVWKMLFEILEDRMSRGEFVVVNATHYKSSLLARYKTLIDKYRYRAYIIDFTDVPLETCLERNRKRDEYKFVPEEALRKMNAVFEAEKLDKNCKEISNKFTVIPRDEAMSILKENLLYDFTNEYENIVVFGDIHGCYEPLKNYFDKNPINLNTKYIFTGDYIDRGIQNREVLEFISKTRVLPNFIYLEGNHEKWLKKYCSKDYAEFKPDTEDKKVLKKYIDDKTLKSMYDKNIKSSVFKEKTVPEIEGLDKGELRQICRKFSQFAYFKFGEKIYLITHGGLPNVPTIFTPTEEFINGVGKYEEVEEIYNSWLQNTADNYVQIHAHRNIFELPTKANDRIYNLCDKPETGKNLRILEISKDGIINVILEPNIIYDKELERREEKVFVMNTKTDNELLQQLNSSKLIQKKVLDDGIVSYNFTRDAFRKGRWNELTVTARGLFIDSESEKIIARSYNKFFNWGETDDSSSASLKKNLKFPVYAYRKENGFLALVSYNFKTDDLFVASKSTTKGDFSQMIREELNKLGEDFKNKIKEKTKTYNSTYIFECINQDLDPHIIRYDKNKLVLLDIVANNFEAQYMPYKDLQEEAKDLGVELKQLDYKFDTWEQLYDFKHQQDISYDYRHEGWVFEDSNGFMVKYKTRYYKFWKYMRGVKQNIEKGQNVKKAFVTEDEIRVFNLMRSMPLEQLQSKSIIDIQDLYYNILDK